MMFRYLGSASELCGELRSTIVRDLTMNLRSHRVDEYFREKFHVISESDHVSVAMQNDECFGLIAVSELPFPEGTLSYIETLLVSERFHGSFASYGLIASVFSAIARAKGSLPNFIAMKTFNPKTYVLMQRFAGQSTMNFYPVFDRQNTSRLIRVAKRIAALVAPGLEFDADHGVVRNGGGVISSSFWPIQPLSKSTVINEKFFRHLGNNDRMLCVLDTTHPTAEAEIMKLARLGRE